MKTEPVRQSEPWCVVYGLALAVVFVGGMVVGHLSALGVSADHSPPPAPHPRSLFSR